MSATCPNCNAARVPESTECASCGVNYEKFTNLARKKMIEAENREIRSKSQGSESSSSVLLYLCLFVGAIAFLAYSLKAHMAKTKADREAKREAIKAERLAANARRAAHAQHERKARQAEEARMATLASFDPKYAKLAPLRQEISNKARELGVYENSGEWAGMQTQMRRHFDRGRDALGSGRIVSDYAEKAGLSPPQCVDPQPGEPGGNYKCHTGAGFEYLASAPPEGGASACWFSSTRQEEAGRSYGGTSGNVQKVYIRYVNVPIWCPMTWQPRLKRWGAYSEQDTINAYRDFIDEHFSEEAALAAKRAYSGGSSASLLKAYEPSLKRAGALSVIEP